MCPEAAVAKQSPNARPSAFGRAAHATLRCADFFAGIGGMRLGFQQAGKQRVKTVFANDFDLNCEKTYRANFGGDFSLGDITELSADQIPDFDIMLGGFPCQAFSQAGYKLGFADTRGTLFFELARIIGEKRPMAFLLENVSSLERHGGGKTMMAIRNTIEKELGYQLHTKVLNSRNFNVPQNRPRIYMVGFREPVDFQFPKPKAETKFLKDILEEDPEEHTYLSQQYFEGMERHRKRHEAKGNGFGYLVLKKEGVANTLVLGGMGRERNLVEDKIIKPWRSGRDKLKWKNKRGLRRLSIKECARCQGFPNTFKFPVARVHAYRQIANSVSVPVIKSIARQMLKCL